MGLSWAFWTGRGRESRNWSQSIGGLRFLPSGSRRCSGSPNAKVEKRDRRDCQESPLPKALLGEDDGLHARDFEALAAAHVLARQHVVFAKHVGAGLGEAGAVAFVGTSGKLAFLGADQPVDLILAGLMAVGTVQRGRLLILTLVEKVAFFHRQSLVPSLRSGQAKNRRCALV